MSIVLAVVLCTVVGALGAVILVAASKFMAVEEDPRIEQVTGCLAGANCGGCGYAGCADYAKAIVMDGVPCDKCAPGGPKAAFSAAVVAARVSPWFTVCCDTGRIAMRYVPFGLPERALLPSILA